MIQADTFVGSLAIGLAILLAGMALGPSEKVQIVNLVNIIRRKFGEQGVRMFLAFVAMVLLVAGVMILKDVRPAFASPEPEAPEVDYRIGVE